MVDNIHLIVLAACGLFGAFTIALAYGQWATRGMDACRTTTDK